MSSTVELASSFIEGAPPGEVCAAHSYSELAILSVFWHIVVHFAKFLSFFSSLMSLPVTMPPSHVPVNHDFPRIPAPVTGARLNSYTKPRLQT